MTRISRLATAVTLAAALAAGTAVAGCRSEEKPPTEYAEICVDQEDNRVSEDMCRNGFNSDAASTFLWMYFVMSYTLPPYGGHINRMHGTAIRPSHVAFYRVPAAGGTGFKPPKNAPPVKVDTPPKQQPARPAPAVRVRK